MPREHPTRRRAIAILAGTAAALATSEAEHLRATADLAWHGTAMGADASIVFCGVERDRARAIAALAVTEIERLERALSLFRGDSEIARLNREGVLNSPTGDFRRALALALAMSDMTDGLFDPTVQALWEAHVDWFTAVPDGHLPPEPRIAAARAAVDWRRITMMGDTIRLDRGQRVTLNGLGQGYVTDRVADLLRAHGLRHVLVDLGEQRALGPRENGTPWLIARAGAETLRLFDGALATSEGSGCILGTAGAAHHLFDPRTGRSAMHWQRVTVQHRSAAVADALSTALYAAAPSEIEGVLARVPAARVWATDREGQESNWTSSAGVAL